MILRRTSLARSRLGLAWLLPLLSLSLSCAYLRGVGGPRLFSETDAAAGEPATEIERRYEGSLRLPLIPEWMHEFPDEGVWAVSRFEAGLPLVDGERIVVGSSRARGLRIVDRSTGALLSTATTVNPVQCRPVKLGDHLLVADTGGYVYLLNADGETLWRYHADGPIYESPAFDAETVYVATSTDVVAALDRLTGAWRWSYRPEERLSRGELSVLGSTAPVLREGRVYIGLSDGRLVCLDASTGTKQWEIEIAEGRFRDVDATPVFTDSGLLITGSYSGPVVAVDPATQQVVWRHDSGVNGHITLMHDRVFFADEAGDVHSLDALNGSENWSWRPKGSKDLLNTPVGQGRYLLVAHNGGALYAMDAFSGDLLWRFEPRESLLGAVRPPTISGRQVLHVTGDGRLRSLRAPPGFYDTGEDEPSRRDSRHLNW